MFEETHLFVRMPALLRRLDRVTVSCGLGLLVGLIWSGYGWWRLWVVPAQASTAPGEILGIATVAPSIYVDVSGAVEKPGLYQFQPGDRVALALEKAGGLTVEADTQYVAKTLNLAQKLTDGEKLYIPWARESIVNNSQDYQETTDVASSTSLTSINTATQAELEALPQIGEKRALEIIQNRPYSQLTDLMDKGVVAESLFNELKSLITL